MSLERRYKETIDAIGFTLVSGLPGLAVGYGVGTKVDLPNKIEDKQEELAQLQREEIAGISGHAVRVDTLYINAQGKEISSVMKFKPISELIAETREELTWLVERDTEYNGIWAGVGGLVFMLVANGLAMTKLYNDFADTVSDKLATGHRKLAGGIKNVLEYLDL